MRQRLLTLRPTVLALTFIVLLAIPAAAAAQTGPVSTITMQPESAAPGTAVEVSGSGFPGEMTVALRLTTRAGTFDLATAATARDGTFRQLVVLPALPEVGTWALDAEAADGTTASRAFAPAAPQVAPVEVPAAEPASAAATEAAVADSTTSDGVFLVVIGCLLGMVSTGALYAWRMIHDERVQPGMGEANDLIWSDGSDDVVVEPTATSEPFWKAAPREVEAAAREVETAAREVAGSGEHEAPASA